MSIFGLGGGKKKSNHVEAPAPAPAPAAEPKKTSFKGGFASPNVLADSGSGSRNFLS